MKQAQVLFCFIALCFLATANSLICYIGVVGFSPTNSTCVSGACAQYDQNGQRALGCYDWTYCISTLPNSYCCKQDYCNLGGKPTIKNYK